MMIPHIVTGLPEEQAAALRLHQILAHCQIDIKLIVGSHFYILSLYDYPDSSFIPIR